ncbi:MAG: M50 family metallopeptidase [Patescibacteria group bacterium]|nr:M50 family metallopeptidase [Patescibacteria group bacterium]
MTFFQIAGTTLVLSILVLFHEFGHFLAARLFGWEVEEFGIGYPPRLAGKKIGGTIFSLNLIPFGGFCGFSEEEMYSQPKREQLGVMVAGILANFVLGWLFFSTLFAVGYPYIEGEVSIENVNAGSPAEEVGVSEGSLIVSVDGLEVKSRGDVFLRAQKRAGNEITLTVKNPNSGEFETFRLVPRKDPPPGQGPLGIDLDFEGEEKLERVSFFQAPLKGLRESVFVLRDMVDGLSWMLGQLIFAGRVPTEIAGPVGVYSATLQVSQMGIRYLVQFIAFLSLNLALFNILPLPALDGGQLVFVVVEVLQGKKVRTEVKQLINAVGIALLVLLAILVTIQDVHRLL